MSYGWDLENMLKSTEKYIEDAGGLLLMVFGAGLIIFAGFKLWKAVTGRQGQTGGEWLRAGIAFVVGGGMLFGAWNLFNNIAKGGDDTITKLGGSDGLITPTQQLSHFTNTIFK